ncbi:predicted protein [Ostreococcus lucimarinus CCE9901]|jgi:transportin-1|uniref:Importin N-terminal domain-containing protein n=1 Tax=Ostreococcus lucimarinus (strain CCE9901) TaxID=436017 RepID=A4SB49_OSTLU|nr:predicted protein [Ostreococcus lucimarinus CCE9901]ABP01032.1 predicted protein [Ostreococcus lucimarinus CCE9901]|tara:strand:+ start:1315 stop:4047 length:2733 start_codon:yes stop_codon:yes gene_type:complete|eukprot:XP_001422715.1 predicted protein [Ostreococcus lucimarinus CCE9901]
MATAWTPNGDGAARIIQMIAEYLDPRANQREMLGRLEQCAGFPDFNNYLAHVLTSDEDAGRREDVRQSAGLLLKNNLKTSWTTTMSEEYRTYVRETLLRALGHPSRLIRGTCGTCVAVIVRCGGVENWGDLWPTLVRAVEAGDENSRDGALGALYKACEEVNGRLDVKVPGLPDSPAGMVIPRLFALFSSPAAKVRQQAVGVVNMIAPCWPENHYALLDSYLQGLFSLANDPDNDVRRLVCSGLVMLIHICPEKLAPNLREIIVYMLERQDDEDKDVAMESCEFWGAFCEAELGDDYVQILREFTPRLIPVLLTNMAYTEDDEEVISAEDDEVNVGREDRDQDIKPTFRDTKDKGSQGEGEDDGQDDSDDFVWNLRKSSANGLDILSNVFGDELLPLLLPVVEQRLRESRWEIRESAILALGAVAEGCSGGLLQYLPMLINFLLPMLDDARPLVRSTTCWTLSRFSRWTLQCARPSNDPNAMPQQQGMEQLNTLTTALCKRCLDHNKHVQAAACGAIATLLAEGQDTLAPWTETIVQTLTQALATYQRKNMRNLYDALTMLAENIGPSIEDARYAGAILPGMLQKWENANKVDPELYHLLECLTAIIVGLGQASAEFSSGIFAKCISALTYQLQQRTAVQRGEMPAEEYAIDIVICTLDLLSGLCEGMGQAIEPLVAQSPIRDILIASCMDESPGVRRSAFALVGDLTRSSTAHLTPSLQQLMELIVAQLQPAMVISMNMSVCNNASWAAGEIAIRTSSDVLRPFVAPLAQCLVQILDMRMVNRALGENAAISLGRLSMTCPEELQGGLAHFITSWCSALRRLRDGVEKEHGFMGLCKLIQMNPSGATSGLSAFVEAVASWRQCRNNELVATMGQLVRGFKDHVGTDQWAMVVRDLEPGVMRKLAEQYGV